MNLNQLWKIERRVWLKGPQACAKHIHTEALVTPPPPFPTQRAWILFNRAESIRPFDDVAMDARAFTKVGNTLSLTYLASARHKRFSDLYYARCTTTYLLEDECWKVLSHHHDRLGWEDYSSLMDRYKSA